MVIVEKSFPRGGVAQPSAATADKSEKIIFGATQLKKKSDSKKNAKKIAATDTEEVERIEVASAGLVSYQSIQDGQLIMGIVKTVDQICVKIALPGRMTVKVLALSISDSYTKSVSEFVIDPDRVENYKPLTEMYEVGQIVYGKVMDVKERETGQTDVSFSLKPVDVHSELVHSNIKKGFVFNGAIEEVQEHGYIIETGVRSLRCFLPFEKSQPGHAVGQLVFMKVEELKAQSAATTIRCKEISQANLKIKDQIDPNLDYFMPGGIVSFTVTKHLKDGLQGTLMNGAFTGYVNEQNLESPLASLESIEENSTLSARILYVAPLTKFVYLSLNLFETDEQSTVYQRGEVVKNAAVHHIGGGGIVVVLDNKHKGLISLKAVKAKNTGNFDMDQVLNKYTKKSKHAVRILDYDLVGCTYVCTDDPAVVNEKVFTVGDVSAGDIITATVVDKDPKLGGYQLKIGRAKGVIERLFLAPSTGALTEKSKLKCRIVAINTERNIAYVTNLPEYMAKDSKILNSLDDAKVNGLYLGTIVKCDDRFLLVKFFNNIKGILYRTRLNGASNFYEGQSMHFRILSRNSESIILGLPEDTFEIGEFCQAEVTHVLETGLEIHVQSKDKEGFSLKAFVPNRLLSEFSDLTDVKQKTYTIGQEVTACCISKNVFSIRDVPYFLEGAVEWKRVHPGDICRAFVKNVEGEVIEVVVPIKGYNKTVKLHRKMLLINAAKPISIVLVPEQVLYVKILSKEVSTKTIGVSAKLTDVWDGDLAKTGEYFEKYLTELRGIKKVLKKQSKAIARLTIGEKIATKFQSVDEDTGDWVVEIEKTKGVGLIKRSLLGKQKAPKEGASVECVLLWVDYRTEVSYLSSNAGDISRITSDKHIPPNLVNKTGINAKVVLKTDNVMICALKKGSNPLVFVPTRLGYNDFEAGSTALVNEGEFCKVAFIHENLPIAVLDETYRLWHDVQKNKRKLEEKLKEMPPTKKMKRTPNETKKSQKREEPAEDSPMFYEDRIPSPVETESVPVPRLQSRKRTLEESRTPLQVKKSETNERPPRKEEPQLPGATNFWSTDPSTTNAADSSSDDEEEQKEDTAAKKKKQTTAEKYKAAREEEARLRDIEEKYANPNILPETTDQFDRLVLSEPNNSKNWINYMVFYLQAMEIDKARAVARRALKAISFRESEELLNIWVALLNLELRYGTKESFNDVLKESLLSNDQFKIYMRVLEILSEANKTQELIDVIGTVSKKFKDSLEIWKSCAIAFYKVGIHDRAEQMMHKALAVLPDREHVNTIVTFANVTHKYAKDPEKAHVLLDQVVTSYPKRVDVWSQLIDMLIKDDRIESARRTLERAVIQKIPLKKMRTIFKKYMEFEQRHGTPELVEKVKILATDYIKNNV